MFFTSTLHFPDKVLLLLSSNFLITHLLTYFLFYLSKLAICRGPLKNNGKMCTFSKLDTLLPLKCSSPIQTQISKNISSCTNFLFKTPLLCRYCLLRKYSLFWIGWTLRVFTCLALGKTFSTRCQFQLIETLDSWKRFLLFWP